MIAIPVDTIGHSHAWTRRIGLYVLAPALLLLALPAAVNIFTQPDLGFVVNNLQIAHVVPGGPAALAGVQPGDRLRAVDGQPLSTMISFYLAVALHDAPTPIQLLLYRGQTQIHAQLTPRPAPRAQLTFRFSMWITALAFVIAAWVVFFKRDDDVSRTFFGLCLIFAFFLFDIPNSPNYAYIFAKYNLYNFLQLLLPALFLHFAHVFPSPSPQSPWHKRPYLLYLPAFILMPTSIALQLANSSPASTSAVILQFAALLYLLVCFSASLVLLARKALRRDLLIPPTRMRVVLFGLLAGLFPFLVANIANGPYKGLSIPHWEYLGLPLVIVPIAFALAISVHGPLDGNFVIRHGLIYASLTLLALCMYVIGWLVFGILMTPLYNIPALPGSILAASVSMLSLFPLRRAAVRLVDRTFYPMRRPHRDAVMALGRHLALSVTHRDILDSTTVVLHDLFEPAFILFALRLNRRSDVLHVMRDSGMGTSSVVAASLDLDCGAARLLAATQRPMLTEELKARLGTEDGGAFAELLSSCTQGELFVPAVTDATLCGLIVLGPQKSGAIYGQDDLANCAILARYMASALDTASAVRDHLLQPLSESQDALRAPVQQQDAMHNREAELVSTDEATGSALRVFICYARNDVEVATTMFLRLQKAGMEPWLDKFSLVHGDDWEEEINKAVFGADFFVPCLRPGFDRIGFRQQEIRWAISALQRRPPGKCFIIPYIVEPCELPGWCKGIHAGGDLNRPTDFDELLRALRKHAGYPRGKGSR